MLGMCLNKAVANNEYNLRVCLAIFMICYSLIFVFCGHWTSRSHLPVMGAAELPPSVDKLPLARGRTVPLGLQAGRGKATVSGPARSGQSLVGLIASHSLDFKH